MSEYSHAELLKMVMAGGDLTREQTRAAFNDIMEGLWTESQIGRAVV